MPVSKFPINPGGVNTGNPLQNTYCPLHMSMLREHYEKGKSVLEIAKLIADMLGSDKSLSSHVVSRWLKKANVNFRSNSHATIIAYRKGRKAISLKCLHAAHSLPRSQKQLASCVKWNKKGIRAAKRSAQARRITCACANPNCPYKKIFERRRCEINQSGKYYCCKECSNACAQTTGQQVVTAKLSEYDVFNIRLKYSRGGISMRLLAREYDVCTQTVCNIIHSKTWSAMRVPSGNNGTSRLKSAAQNMPELAAHLGITPEQLNSQM